MTGCPSCGAPVDPRVARELRSVQAIRRLVERDDDLPPRLREDLARRLEQSLARLDAEIEKLRPTPPAPEPDPEPEPVVEPEPVLEPDPEPQPEPELEPFVATGPAVEPPPPPPVAPEPTIPPEPAEPSVWERLGPAFTENILFALAAFLLVAGAVFFVTTAWTTMTGQEKLLVILGGLQFFGFLLFGAGRLLNRGGTLPEVERVLLVVVAFLVPVAAAAAGELLRSSTLLGIVGSLTVLVPAWFALRSAARRTEPVLHPGLAVALSALSLLAIAGATAGGSSVTAGAVLAVVVFGIGHLGGRVVIPRVGENLNPVLWASLLVAFATLVAAGTIALAASRAGVPATHPLAIVGIAISAIALFGVQLECALTRSTLLPAGRAMPLLVAVQSLALAGTAVAAGNERALLVASLIGAIAALSAGFRLPSPWLLLEGLALSAVAYVYLPAPFRDLAIALRDRTAASLGYGAEPLPLSYYAVTLVPYVAITGAVGIWLRRRGRIAHARVFAAWSLATAGGLCLMSVVLGADLRAPAAAFAAQGTLLLVLGHFARNPRYVYVGTGALYVALSFLLGYLEVAFGVRALAFGTAGLLGLAVARFLARRDARDDFSAAAGRALLHVTLAMTAFVGLALSAMTVVAWAEGSGLPGDALDVIGCAVFLTLVSVTGVFAKFPAAVPGACLIAARLVEGSLAGVGLDPVGEWRPLFFTLAAALLLFLRRPLRATAARGADLSLTIALLAMYGLGLFPRMLPWFPWGFDGPGAWALAAGAVLLTVTGLQVRKVWVGALAAPLIALAGYGFASALGYRSDSAAGAVGVSAAALLLAVLANPLYPFHVPWRLFVGAIALLVTVRLFPAAGWGQYGVPLAAALAALAARWTLHAERGEPLPSLCSIAGSIVVAWVPIGLLAAGAAESHWLGMGMVTAAAIAMFWAGRNTPARFVSAVHLLLGLFLASSLSGVHEGDAALHCLTMGLVVAGGWFLTGPLPKLGTAVFTLALAALASLGIAHGVLRLEVVWQPAILFGISAGALLLTRVRALRLQPIVVGILAGALGAGGVAWFSSFGVFAGGYWDAPGVAALLSMAALLAVTGFVARVDAIGGLAAPVVLLAGYASAQAMGYPGSSPAGVVGVSSGAMLLALLCFPIRPFRDFWRGTIAAAAILVTAWLFVEAGPDRWAVPLAAAIAALAARLSMHAGRGEPARTLAGVAGSVVLAWVPAGLLFAAEAPAHWLGMGMVAAAAMTILWTGRHVTIRAVAGAHLLVALILAALACIRHDGHPAWHAVTIVLVMAGARALIGQFRVFGTALFLLGLGALLSLALGRGIAGLGLEWQPAILAAFSLLAMAARRVGVLGLQPVVTNAFATIPLAVLTGYWCWGAVVVAAGTMAPAYGWITGPALLTAAILYVLGAFVLSRSVSLSGRDAIWITAVGLTLFAYAPLNRWLGDVFPRPDLEIAVLALLLAARLPVRVLAGDSVAGARASIRGVYAVAIAAAALTAGEWNHISTPLTLFALVLPPVALLLRNRDPAHATIAGFTLLAAALSLSAWWFPAGHDPKADLLLLLSLVSAVVLFALRQVAERARSVAWLPEGTGQSLLAPAAAAHLLSLSFLAANILVVAGSGMPAGAAWGLAATVAMGIGAFVSLRIATTRNRPSFLHGTVLSLLLLYAFLATRTGLLDVVSGIHGHALLVIGTGIFLAAERVPAAFRGPLRGDGLCLALPAVLLATFELLTAATPPGSTASALFLAGGFAGLAAVRMRKPVFAAASVILLNLAVFALWRRNGIVDPAFYGVPPGLTLLIGAELAKKHLARGGHLALFLVGATLLYGSVGIQVLSVERPDHALVLFGLGLLTVGGGVVLRRNSLLAAGTSVVVLDVVAYLARNGFQRGFLGAVLLLLAGMTVLGVGTLAAKRRKGKNVSGT